MPECHNLSKFTPAWGALMFWWRGNGLLIGFLASVPAVAVIQAGASHPALAYAASALMIFLMRDTLGAESSLFSISTRFWPPLLLVVALMVQFSPASGRSGSKNDFLHQVSELQASLPLKLDEHIRLDRVELQGSTLTGRATSTGPDSSAEAKRKAQEQALRQHYCEKLPSLWEAHIGLSIKVTVPPRSLNDRVETSTIDVNPSVCQAKP